MIKKNEIVRSEITGMTDLGYGVCRIDGLVTFVDGGVTGDVLDVKIIKIGRDMLVGRVENIITPSPVRTNDDCPHKRCGGCIFGAVTREYELELKRGFVISAFKKQGLEPTVNEVQTDGRRALYRNKVQMPVCDGKWGFFAKHSHEITDSEGCILSPAVFDEIIKYVVSLELPLRHICIRRGEMTGEIMLTLVSKNDVLPDEKGLCQKLTKAFPDIKSIVLNTNKEDTNVILGGKSRAIYGEDKIYDVLCGCRFGISSKSFYQVNRGCAEMLYDKAISLAVSDGERNITDLFCGAGTIGISAAKKHPEITVKGVEIVPEAVENARENARVNGIENAVFVCSDANGASVRGSDAVIVDPPRKGIGEKLIKTLSGEKIKKIVYVSCNPETLARDCALLINEGYSMGEVTPFDMFPRTGHVETVALLGRKQVEYRVEFDVDVTDLKKPTRKRATYPEIKEYVKERFGLNVSSLNIAQVKDKCGLGKRENYYKGKDGHRVPSCPEEKEKAIIETFKHFGMV